MKMKKLINVNKQTVIHLQKHRAIRKNEYNEHHDEHQLPRKHPRYRKQA